MSHLDICRKQKQNIFYIFPSLYWSFKKKKFFDELKHLGYELELQPCSFIIRLFSRGGGGLGRPLSKAIHRFRLQPL